MISVLCWVSSLRNLSTPSTLPLLSMMVSSNGTVLTEVLRRSTTAPVAFMPILNLLRTQVAALSPLAQLLVKHAWLKFVEQDNLTRTFGHLRQTRPQARLRDPASVSLPGLLSLQDLLPAIYFLREASRTLVHSHLRLLPRILRLPALRLSQLKAYRRQASPTHQAV